MLITEKEGILYYADRKDFKFTITKRHNPV